MLINPQKNSVTENHMAMPANGGYPKVAIC